MSLIPLPGMVGLIPSGSKVLSFSEMKIEISFLFFCYH